MKVLLVNGSPHVNGSTFVALSEVAKSLEANGIETSIFHVGAQPIAGCIGCGYCRKKGECVVGDVVNDFSKIVDDYDGFVFGTPVHFASACGSISGFMDRAFFSVGKKMQNKPAASVVVCRRGGASATFDQMNKYYGIRNMLTVGSTYWNSLHALTPDEVSKDAEGLQVMRHLGVNMAWVLKCIEAGQKAGIEAPKYEEPIVTKFAE